MVYKVVDKEKFVELIKSSPHWRVLIRPVSFNPNLISKLPELWQIMEACSVYLRGWTFPMVDNRIAKRINGNDWIGANITSRSDREHWRFYQSGQFIDINEFRENSYPEYLNEIKNRPYTEIPNDFKPSGFLDVTLTLYRVTEIFEFAARLANKGLFKSGIKISIELNGIKDHFLATLDPHRFFTGFYPATSNKLGEPRQYTSQELIANSSRLALETVVWFFNRFSWMDVPTTALEETQRKLLERRL
ncbi:hypothetical protein CEE37_10005 [candidate division LCP-89 bacterium B3_LCP]|uniref:Uncharacterized protein n=1 Tax=candidate division LCP-89 bacterium B3_LCP TaxID=2012998 RepID=A0A532UYM5_UNCL8|nr:MAG: hypothetical protein CEE37_10005 [candidate division LCP-89 bacterium B3_LCP]